METVFWALEIDLIRWIDILTKYRHGDSLLGTGDRHNQMDTDILTKYRHGDSLLGTGHRHNQMDRYIDKVQTWRQFTGNWRQT